MTLMELVTRTDNGHAWVTVLLLSFKFLLFLALFTVVVIPVEADVGNWRSALYPDEWVPSFTDDEGRFLHDFSYAGYHMGEKPLPDTVPGPRIDVTKSPYNADNTGKESATQAIQNAINEVGRAGGGTVYLPPGTYRITFRLPGFPVALLVAHSNVVIEGSGTDQTFLFVDETVTRGKSVIKVEPTSGMSWTRPRDHVIQTIRTDVKARDTVIPLDGTPRFSVGEWVVIQYDLTTEWVAEHNMSDGWDSSIPGPSFYRQIIAIDEDNATITVDTPVRYDVNVRDNGRVYRVNDPLTEVGLVGFSIGMREHPSTTGWGSSDHGQMGTGAYDVHAGRAISFIGVVNGWMKDVSTYKPDGNENAHVHSIGFSFSQSRFLTIRNVTVENPQYRGGGGNGYPIVVGTQESLYDNVRAVNGRHNFTITGQRTSGNVIYRGIITNPIGSLVADFHAYLSMANLIDNLTIDRDRFDAADRSGAAGVSGFPKHGVSTTQSVFWNNIGVAYGHDMPAIIRSDQYGWGYVIGTRGPAARVIAPGGNPRTEPKDFVEGEGEGDTLQPQSLYYDQLHRRLLRAGKTDVWELIKNDLIPPKIMEWEHREGDTAPRLIDMELPLILDEDFEGAGIGELPSNWQSLLSSNSPDVPTVIRASDDIDPNPNNQVLALSRTADTSNVTGYAIFNFPPVKEHVRITFHMYATSILRSLRVTLGGSSLPASSVHPSAANSAIFLAMNNGVVRSLRDAPLNEWNHGGFYTAEKWHKVTLDIDITSKTFSVYIDDSKVAENVDPIPFHTDRYDDLSTIAFGYQSLSAHNNTDPVYVDNVMIWGQ